MRDLRREKRLMKLLIAFFNRQSQSDLVEMGIARNGLKKPRKGDYTLIKNSMKTIKISNNMETSLWS